MAKRNKKSAVYILAGLAFLVTTLYTASLVYADEVTGYPTVVERIAKRFNLSPSEVNDVFEEERVEMWEKRKQTLNDRLSSAVSDGKITQNQKEKLLAKIEENISEGFAAREQKREEMISWMNENGIDSRTLGNYLGGFGVGHGPEGRHHLN